MTNEPPLTIMPDTKGWQRIVASQRQALYEKEQELERLRAENARLLSSDRETLIAFLTREQDEYLAENRTMRPVVEAARAWVKTPIEAPPHGLYLHPLERDLSSAVAAYEAAQGWPATCQRCGFVSHEEGV